MTPRIDKETSGFGIGVKRRSFLGSFLVIGTLRGVGGGGVGGINAHNKDIIRPISGSIVPCLPLTPLRVPMI